MNPSFLSSCLDTVLNLSDLLMGCNFYHHLGLVVLFVLLEYVLVILLGNSKILYCCLMSITVVDTWVMLKLARLGTVTLSFYVYINISVLYVLFCSLFFVTADLFVGYLYLLHSCLGSMGILAWGQRSYRGGMSIIHLILCLRMSNACSV